MKTWPKPDYGTVLFSRGRGGGGYSVLILYLPIVKSVTFRYIFNTDVIGKLQILACTYRYDVRGSRNCFQGIEEEDYFR